MELALAILKVLIALPKIGALIKEAIAALTLQWVSAQNEEARAAFADAAAFAARANTAEERYAAAKMWHKALCRPRALP